MTSIRQHIPLSLGISHQVMTHYPLFRQYLHSILLFLILTAFLLHQKHLSKASFPKQLYRLKALYIDFLRKRRHLCTARILPIHEYVLFLCRALSHAHLHRGVILLLANPLHHVGAAGRLHHVEAGLRAGLVASERFLDACRLGAIKVIRFEASATAQGGGTAMVNREVSQNVVCGLF